MTKEIKLHKYLVDLSPEDSPLEIQHNVFVVAKTPKEARELVETILKLKGKPVSVISVKGTRKDPFKNRYTLEELYKKLNDNLYRLKHHIKKGDIL